MPESRFLHPYYILNGLLGASYVLLRMKRLRPYELLQEDMFGITREQQIYGCLVLILITRSMSAPTIDVYLASAFMFARVTILLCLWYMDNRLMALFAALWTLIYAVCPQPRFRLPASVTTLNNVSFNDRIAKNKHRTVYVLWCHATWSARCSQLAPILATLSKRYKHPRIEFATLDVSKYPETADSLGVSVSAASKQLPTIICFNQGKEVARIPTVDSRGNIPKEWTRGFTAAHVAEHLNLVSQLKIARQWEKEAQDKYKKTKQAKKTT